jgi:hypothetical protein
MARFYSKHEMAKIDKNLNEEELLDTQKYKNDLKRALNTENHRINIDSAKKKAVNQRMDYDGFHQMVLGADLKGIKKDEISSIVTNRNTIINASLISRKLGEEVDVFSKNFISTGNPEKDKIKIGERDNSVLDYKAFTKMWKGLSSTGDKIALLNGHVEQFENILEGNLIDADFFTDVFYQAGLFLKENSEGIASVLRVLGILIDNKQFLGLKKFIGKKVKTVYSEIDLDKFDPDEKKLVENIKQLITN